MRTTLELDDRLMAALLARHPGASKREAWSVRSGRTLHAQASLWTRDTDFARIQTGLPGMRLYPEP